MARLCHSDRLRLNARWTMTDTDVREYAAQAASTDTFGRVLCSARNHHFVVDGPVQNGCPGEAINPAELFLSGVAACGVELVQVLAKAQAGSPSSGEGRVGKKGESRGVGASYKKKKNNKPAAH